MVQNYCPNAGVLFAILYNYILVPAAHAARVRCEGVGGVAVYGKVAKSATPRQPGVLKVNVHGGGQMDTRVLLVLKRVVRHA